MGGLQTLNLLIANRGEIAVRIARSARDLGITPYGVFEAGDHDHLGALDAAQAVSSYLSVEDLLAAAAQLNCQLVHPGYGYLAENAGFAQAVIDAGLTWVGPNPDAIELMGSKTAARARMIEAGVPVVPSDGFPCLVKAAGGGGGRGMRLVHTPEELEEAKATASREALAAFGSAEVFVERYITGGRHVEVQVLADKHGGVVHLHERECSVQRRHQKVVEEAPHYVAGLGEAAVEAARAVNYVGAGTVEFLVSGEAFYFLEMNTRIQVEHPVTEAVTGIDLVAEQLRVALDGRVPEVPAPRGHAIEARIYAEDPYEGYAPRTGTVVDLVWPEGVRVDTHLASGSEVGTNYDPMLAKVIAYGRDRDEARRKLVRALKHVCLQGVVTNRSHLAQILEHPDFVAGDVHTGWLEQQQLEAPTRPVQACTAVLAHELSDLGPFDGFRNNRFRAQELTVDGHTMRWAPTRDGLTAEGLPLHIRRDGATVDVVHGPHSFKARVVAEEDGWHVWTPGWSGFLERDPVFPDHSAQQDAGGLVAQMPGKVLRVLVQPGESVEAGQPLLVLEAMKMEQTLRAPDAGSVEAVLVGEGDQVNPGDVLARLSAPGED